MSNFTPFYIEDTSPTSSISALKDLSCRLIGGHVRNCGNSIFAGLDCIVNADDFSTSLVEFSCELDIDTQNDTSYICNMCNNESVYMGSFSNFTNCVSSFKMSLTTVMFESALKALWLRLPSWPPDFCDYFPWESAIRCYTDSLYVINRTLYVDDNVTSTEYNNSDKFYENFQCIWNVRNDTTLDESYKTNYDWSFLFVILFIVAGGVGNILVCLAVCLDKRLQNVTNYFLLSLAIADLLVSLFVMPMGAIPGFLGK